MGSAPAYSEICGYQICQHGPTVQTLGVQLRFLGVYQKGAVHMWKVFPQYVDSFPLLPEDCIPRGSTDFQGADFFWQGGS